MEAYPQIHFGEEYSTPVSYNFMGSFGCAAQATDFSESWGVPQYSSASSEEPLVRYCTPDNPVYCQLTAAPISNMGGEVPFSTGAPVYACESAFTTVPSEASSQYVGSHEDREHLSFTFDDIMDTSLSPFPEASFPSEPQGRKRRQSLGPADRRHHQRSAANRRERKRMLLINQHFEVLRAALPAHAQLSLTANAAASPEERRLSKVETLKSAIAYISDLAAYLRTLGSADGPTESDSPARLRVRLEEPVFGAGEVISKLFFPKS